jgi:LemA protein
VVRNSEWRQREVGAAVRGVLPVVDPVVDRRRRHQVHRGGPRIVVARRRIPSPAGDRFGRGTLRLSARKDVYTAYVPFAIAAGAAALWAKKHETSVGTPAPRPDWYNSSSTTSCGYVGSSSGPSFDSFESALSSSIGAYTPSRSSSSFSSSGGGGFSGGGGGGGGGIMVRFLLLLVLVLAVLVLIGFVMGYNKIRAADVGMAEALSGIDVELMRRASLIPSLVHACRRSPAREKGILDHVTNAHAALTSATTGKSVAQRSAAEKEFDTALAPLLALGQSYPQLNSSNNFLDLQDNLADTENKLAFARQCYNDSVATLNRLITTIPRMFVAPMTGVSEREYYQTPR